MSSVNRLDPIEGILEILRRGAMSGTNKLGLLLTLLDIAHGRVDDSTPITLDEISSHYLQLHWQHGRPYRGNTLRQSHIRKSRSDGTFALDTSVMQQVGYLRSFLEEQGRGDWCDLPYDVVLHRLRRTPWKRDWSNLEKTAKAHISESLWKNPIRRLQNLPGQPMPFLYELSGTRTIQLLPGVAMQLKRYANVLVPLVEFRFAEWVTKLNRAHLHVSEYTVHDHLFGTERSHIPDALRLDLTKVQGDYCIYTSSRLSGKEVWLDHVLPWSRVRLSHIENFVMTTKHVNMSKSDSLVGPAVIERWLNYVITNRSRLNELAWKHNWPTDFHAVHEVALATYDSLSSASGVWNGEDSGVQPLGNDGRARVMDLLSTACRETSMGLSVDVDWREQSPGSGLCGFAGEQPMGVGPSRASPHQGRPSVGN